MKYESDDYIIGFAQSARRILLGCAIGAALMTASFCTFANDGRTYFMSVGNMLDLCGAKDEAQVGACHGFIIGVLDAGNGVHYCLPSPAKARDFIDPLLKAMGTASARERTLPANEVIIGVLASAHPCKREPTGQSPTPQRNPRSGGWA